MSLSLSRCEVCKHYRGWMKEKECCDAFLDGIPDDKNTYDYDDGSECANGIKYENGELKKFTPDPNSILAKMHRI